MQKLFYKTLFKWESHLQTSYFKNRGKKNDEMHGN